MGSSGSGMFGTYLGGGTGSAKVGKDAGMDSCPLEIKHMNLEDVALSTYFVENGDVPSCGESVEVSIELLNKRLAVVLSDTQEDIGNVPVSYNILNFCIAKGKRYSGSIKASGISPIPYVVVTLYAE